MRWALVTLRSSRSLSLRSCKERRKGTRVTEACCPDYPVGPTLMAIMESSLKSRSEEPQGSGADGAPKLVERSARSRRYVLTPVLRNFYAA